MLNKIHRRLTFFCTGITGIIFLIMSLLYLYVSEKNMHDNALMTFENDLYGIVNTLYDTNIISARYLSALEAQGNYMISLMDNGSPLLYGTITDDEASDKKRSLMEEAKKTCSSETLPVLAHIEPYTGQDFAIKKLILSDRKVYYMCHMFLQKEYGQLDIFVLSDTSGLTERLTKHRQFFFAVFLCVILFLFVFFHILTRHLLSPAIQSRKKQTEFIASASHELRTPLSIILSSVSLLHTTAHDEQKELCRLIEDEGLVMKKLIDELLLLANSDQNNVPLHKKNVPLDTLVLNMAETFEVMARDKNLNLSATLPEEELPLCSCDEFRIRQVLSVLLCNAISYTHKGNITITLSFMKNSFFIKVADTGDGIPDEDKKRIFERFYRADKARSEKEHFGLGLSIAAEIVKAHKGTIRVSDTPGGGSTFIVSLPL